MHLSAPIRMMTYSVIASGVALSFAGAAVPHFATGYTLHLGALFAGLLPYLVYGVFLNVVRGGPLLAIGVLLLGIDLAVKLPERFLAYDGYSSGVIYYHPVVASLALLIALGILARHDKLWQGIRDDPAPPAKPRAPESAD